MDLQAVHPLAHLADVGIEQGDDLEPLLLKAAIAK